MFLSLAPAEIPGIGLTVPVMWLYLLVNVVTQYPYKKCISRGRLFSHCLWSGRCGFDVCINV